MRLHARAKSINPAKPKYLICIIITGVEPYPNYMTGYNKYAADAGRLVGGTQPA